MNYIGYAKDIHKLVYRKSTTVLAGYNFKSKYKILSISDGDVILHSIANAILGACQCKDIGSKFNDSNKKNKNLNSRIILNYALSKLKSKNLKINNVDLMIVCDKIMINTIYDYLIKSLRSLLKTNNISLKATRFEQNKLLIESNCIVLLEDSR